jgi:hypothetical protein
LNHSECFCATKSDAGVAIVPSDRGWRCDASHASIRWRNSAIWRRSPSKVAEMSLAHSIENKVERAYRRGDLFDKRRRLMDNWAACCAGTGAAAENVTPIRAELANDIRSP